MWLGPGVANQQKNTKHLAQSLKPVLTIFCFFLIFQGSSLSVNTSENFVVTVPVMQLYNAQHLGELQKQVWQLHRLIMDLMEPPKLKNKVKLVQIVIRDMGLC